MGICECGGRRLGVVSTEGLLAASRLGWSGAARSRRGSCRYVRYRKRALLASDAENHDDDGVVEVGVLRIELVCWSLLTVVLSRAATREVEVACTS